MTGYERRLLREAIDRELREGSLLDAQAPEGDVVFIPFQLPDGGQRAFGHARYESAGITGTSDWLMPVTIDREVMDAALDREPRGHGSSILPNRAHEQGRHHRLFSRSLKQRHAAQKEQKS